MMLDLDVCVKSESCAMGPCVSLATEGHTALKFLRTFIGRSHSRSLRNSYPEEFDQGTTKRESS